MDFVEFELVDGSKKMMNVAVWGARLGAMAYAIWAVLHFQAAWAVYNLAYRMEPSMAQARVLQDAFNLASFSVAAIGVAITLNWRNDRWGYWINLGVVSVADIGFILFVLVPGYLGLWPGLLGPIFWVIGLLFTTLARIGAPRI